MNSKYPAWTASAMIVLIPLGGVPTANAEKLLRIEYPKPFFHSGPLRAAMTRNMEPPRKEGEPMPVYMVPEGTVLVSKGRPVMSSDPTARQLARLTDGDKSSEEGTVIELAPGLQWIQIDLENSVGLSAIAFWHQFRLDRVYLDVIVQISNDPKFIEGVTTLFNNDHDDSAGFGVGKDPTYVETNYGRLIIGKGTRARYVRCYSNGNTSWDQLGSSKKNEYVEIEVYGVPGA